MHKQFDDNRDIRGIVAQLERAMLGKTQGEAVQLERAMVERIIKKLRDLSSDCAHMYGSYRLANDRAAAVLQEKRPFTVVGFYPDTGEFPVHHAQAVDAYEAVVQVELDTAGAMTAIAVFAGHLQELSELLQLERAQKVLKDETL